MSTICTPALAAPAAPSFGPWLRAAAGVAALAAGAVVVGRRIDFSALSAAQIAWPWIAASLLLNLASIVGKAVVWKITLEALPEGRRTRYAHVVPALFIGFLLNTVLFARVGEVARVAVLARRMRLVGRPVPVKAVAGTVIAEQLLLGAALAVTVLGLLAVCDLPPVATRLAIALIAIVVIGGLLVRLLARGARGRLRSVIDGVVAGNAVLHRPGAVVAAVAAGTVSWVAQIAGIWAALVAFGIHAGPTGAALVFVATTIVQLFPLLARKRRHVPARGLRAARATVRRAGFDGDRVRCRAPGRRGPAGCRTGSRLPRPGGSHVRRSTAPGERRGGASRTASWSCTCHSELVTADG